MVKPFKTNVGRFIPGVQDADGLPKNGRSDSNTMHWAATN